MAISHLNSGEPISLMPFGKTIEGERSVALFKSEQLEVMRLVLTAGKSLPPHRVPGEITLQCLEGSFEVTAAGQTQVLSANHLMFLAGGVEHSLLALTDGTALLTIVLPR